MSVCETCAYNALSGQKQMLDPLDLELHIVRYHVGDRIQALVLWKSS